MKLTRGEHFAHRRAAGAFTLVDALFAMAMAGMLFTSLYAGLAYGFNIIKMARENTRATQIMLEKMETIRLYTWTQINSNGFIPTNKFTVPYYSVNGTNSSLVYTGQFRIDPSGLINSDGLPASYASDMKKVTVRVDWGAIGGTNRTRTMTTFVSKNGMQSYVF
jgi:hypothetical protein